LFQKTDQNCIVGNGSGQGCSKKIGKTGELMHLQCIRLLYNLTLFRHWIYKILKKLTNLCHSITCKIVLM